MPYFLEDIDFYRDVLENLYEGVYFVDRERRITYWNRGAERLTGYKRDDIIGKRCSDDILRHIDQKGVNLCNGLCPLAETIKDEQPRDMEAYLHHRDGHRVAVAIHVAPVRDSKGEIVGAVETFSGNLSEAALHHDIEALKELALIDSLTGIGNRRSVNINLRSKLDEFKRYGYPFGVLFIDIDRFKRVNDTYGHQIGDDVLKMVAKTLSKNVRPFDTMGRWGGEEFIGIIVNIAEERLYSLANRLRLLVEQSSLTIESDSVRVTVSSGGTLSKKEDTVETLVGRADQLMYRSKRAGRNLVTMDFPAKGA